MKLRISATKLAQFGRVGTENYDGSIYSVEDWVKDVTTPFYGNEATEFGQAFGLLITEPNAYKSGESYAVKVENGHVYGFSSDNAKAGIEAMNHYPNALWEVRRVVTIQLAGVELQLVCVVDGLWGNKIIENKTTANFNYDNYRNSLQWQLYLYVFDDCQSVVYEVFEFYKPTLKFPERRFKAHHSFEFSRADMLVDEIESELSSMAYAIKQYNLESYFASK